MELKINKVINREIMHYSGEGIQISSKANKIFIKKNDEEKIIKISNSGWKKYFNICRLTRRALRLDKCNVAPVGENVIIIKNGKVYFYDNVTVVKTLELQNCSNILHQSISVINEKEIIFGEYGSNPERQPVNIYKSDDGGRSWRIVYKFAVSKIRHIHGCYWDKYEEKIWVFTGDFQNECHILVADKEFKELEWLGDGSQTFRACNAFFEKDEVHWIMDSQLETSYHIKLDRVTRKIETLKDFPGPVWYIKRLENGYYLSATTKEKGPGVKSDYAHLMVSKDLKNWVDLYRFKHDGLPMKYFKFGVIGFSDGPQTSDYFHVFCEAVKKYEGKIMECKILE